MASEQTRNENTGSVRGSLVQARTIVGDLHFHHQPRNRGPRWGAASAVGLALLIGAAVLVRHGWWPVAVLLLAAGGLLEWWLISRAIRLGDRATSPDEAISELRRQVRDQWSAERDNRGLQEPRPLRLRWRPTQRPVQVKLTTAEKGRAELRRGELLEGTDETRPAAAALLAAFRQSPRRQLVVLGERGAGKSTLVLLFTLAALDDEAQPVPVLLSVAGWDPGERIEDWVARRVSEEYPVVPRHRAARLLADKRLLPVLDGLDEIPSELWGRALGALNRSALRMVITCRSAEFEAAVTTDGVLAHAAVVEIEPIRPDDARDFFEQRDVEGVRRWDRVIDAVIERPDGPLAELLSSPLMISLARRVYRRPSSQPEELAPRRAPRIPHRTVSGARRRLSRARNRCPWEDRVP
ncbi:NACHT domain-containing protein [Saccharopolyspora antimicrobica]|uniref:NACHT domain-containing protein n=1 Tax=Saccharopolyspora antimicrobica TaxID=455193 RepID=A0A1I5BA84_9PSEU|nr:NACHT domain-containing protein [Saccharopolyspora antimicrobica]RKT86527.1 NACHT domain-containing protein [Saccharopolyspora antimicrobica]SFN71635.1 NACHT domain-containing protein [Saccharopolyspora antimicrobica]